MLFRSKAALWTLEPARLRVRLRGIADGYRQCAAWPRQPVSWSTYRLARALRKTGPRPMPMRGTEPAR